MYYSLDGLTCLISVFFGAGLKFVEPIVLIINFLFTWKEKCISFQMTVNTKEMAKQG